MSEQTVEQQGKPPRGVQKAPSGRYRALTRIHGKVTSLGYYHSLEQAAKAVELGRRLDSAISRSTGQRLRNKTTSNKDHQWRQSAELGLMARRHGSRWREYLGDIVESTNTD